MRSYWVCIMTNNSLTSFYTGVTNDLPGRIVQHRSRVANTFTARYSIRRFVYMEEANNIWDAIAREKQIKRWRREKKLSLIRTMNSAFRDLAEDWQLLPTSEAKTENQPSRRQQAPDPSAPSPPRGGGLRSG